MELCPSIFRLEVCEVVDFVGDPRKLLKGKLIKVQEKRILKQMMSHSKTDRLLLSSFVFDGKRKKVSRPSVL